MSDDKRDLRILIALIVGVFGLGVAIFGVVRGTSATGPGSGVRLTVSIAPPLDAGKVALAVRVVKERCDEKGRDARIVSGGDRVVAEIGEDDPESIGHIVAVIERRASLEVRGHDGTTLLAGDRIAGAQVASGGVKVDLRAPASIPTGARLAFVLDGKEKAVATVDHVAPTDFHVRTDGATEDAALRAAVELVPVIEAGAVPALQVTERTPFTRATGFLPRAWPFFAIGGAMLLVAAFVAFRRP